MEKVIIFNTKSDLGSFQRPQSNNNPSTFNVIPKSALVGMICAVVGIDRDIMRETNMYKTLTEKLRYSVIPRKPFQIKYWSEYGYNHGNVFQSADRPVYTPAKYERLVDVDYDIHVLYDNEDQDVTKLIQNFIENVRNQEYVFPPYMGMANFMIDISYVGEVQPQACNGVFKTRGICTELVVEDGLEFENIRTDDLPTRSVSYLAHDNQSYRTIYFHDNCGTIKAEGNYYEVGEECLEFI